MKPYKAVTNRIIEDEDFKTAAALGIKPIPKNAVVEVIGTFQNYYGNYIKVKYQGYTYYTKAEYLDKI